MRFQSASSWSFSYEVCRRPRANAPRVPRRRSDFPPASSGAVKAEAVKLMQGSPEPTPHGRGAGKEETYEDVARALEELLLEHGYYAATRAESR